MERMKLNQQFMHHDVIEWLVSIAVMIAPLRRISYIVIIVILIYSHHYSPSLILHFDH